MTVGRQRKHDKHLPRRVYFHHGAYSLRQKDGRRVRLGKTYHEAMIEYARIMEDRSPVTTGDLIDAYLKEELPKRKPSTQADYRNIIAEIRNVFGHVRPEVITPRHVYKYRSKRSGPRGNRHVAVLSAILNLGVAKGMLDRNPCHEVKRIKEQPRNRYITDEEYKAVRDLATEPVRLVMDLAVLTALRLGDLRKLPLSAERKDGIEVRPGKNGRRQVIILWTPKLREAWNAAKAYSPRKVRAMTVLVNRSGHTWSENGFNSCWQRLQQKAEKKGIARFTFHDLRAKATERAPDKAALLEDNPQTAARHYLRHPIRVLPSEGVE